MSRQGRQPIHDLVPARVQEVPERVDHREAAAEAAGEDGAAPPVQDVEPGLQPVHPREPGELQPVEALPERRVQHGEIAPGADYLTQRPPSTTSVWPVT